MKKKLNVPVDHNYTPEPSERQDIFDASRSDEYWEYRRRWEENPKNQIVEDFPIHLDIDVTNKCNLKCQMCPRTDLVNRGLFWGEGYITFELFQDLVLHGVEHGLCSVKFNILGEPLLHPELPKMVRFAKEAGVVDTLINTNVTMLTRKLGIELIEAGLDKLFFSFDSPYPEVFNKIRRGANYHKVLNNIKNFMKLRAELGSITPLTRTSMVVMKENAHEVEDFRKMFSPIVDFVAFSAYLQHIAQEDEEDRSATKHDYEGAFCCPQIWQRMFVHTDGEVMVCCMDTARTIKIGNIRQKSLKDLWLGEEYKELRKLHAEGNFDKHPTCKNCALARLQV